MSGKRFKALVVAALLAVTVALTSSPPAAPSVALAAVCDSTASGCVLSGSQGQ